MLHKSALAYFLLQSCRQLKLVATQGCPHPIPASFQERAGLHLARQKVSSLGFLAIHAADLSVELSYNGLDWQRPNFSQSQSDHRIIIILLLLLDLHWCFLFVLPPWDRQRLSQNKKQKDLRVCILLAFCCPSSISVTPTLVQIQEESPPPNNRLMVHPQHLLHVHPHKQIATPA